MEIFQAPSLQMVTFTITEKGYSFNEADLARGLDAVFAMGKLTSLLYERFKAGKLPVTLQSTDNCSTMPSFTQRSAYAFTPAFTWSPL